MKKDGVPAREAIDALKDHGRRITKARRQLLSFILSQEGHWSIQEMVDRVKLALPRVGVATVYRTVKLLVEEGRLTRTMTESGLARFEVTTRDHHDHLSCVVCGKIVEFENSQIERLQEKIAREFGMRLTHHRMELFGECMDPKCGLTNTKGRREKSKA